MYIITKEWHFRLLILFFLKNVLAAASLGNIFAQNVFLKLNMSKILFVLFAKGRQLGVGLIQNVKLDIRLTD